MNQPFGSLDGVQQNTGRNGVHVTGWAADRDDATGALQVLLSVDGAPPTTYRANVSRPDVDAAVPGVGPNHGFDLMLPVTGRQHTVCVTAVNAGRGADQRLGCKTMDAITAFRPSSVTYDIDHAVINPVGLTIKRVRHVNRSRQDRPFKFHGTTTVEKTVGWKDTEGINVEAEADFKVSVPFLDDSVEAKLKVGGSFSFEQNQSTTTKSEFGWEDDSVAERRRITVTSLIATEENLAVPYTMDGNFVYASGATAPGSVHGTFSGVNSDDMQVEDDVYFLDGRPDDSDVHEPDTTSPSAVPVNGRG